MELRTRPQVASLFAVSQETVRQWTAYFAAHLSQLAKPSKGQKRQYTDDDLRVMSLIAEMSAAGKQYADIEAALTNGQRGPLPDAEIVAPSRKLVALQQEIELYRAELTKALSENSEQRGEIRLLRILLSEAQAEIARLHREAGKREG